MWKLFSCLVLLFAFLLLNVNAECTADGYFLKATRVIPRNYREYIKFTQDIKCVPDDLQVHYAVGSWGNETLMGCFCNSTIFGYCLEMNKGTKWTIQPLQHALCTEYEISPCKSDYDSVLSYFWFQCYDFYGNLSPENITQENEILQKANKELKNDIAILKSNITNTTNQDISTCFNTNNTVYFWASFCVIFLLLLILSVVANIYQYRTAHKSIKENYTKSGVKMNPEQSDTLTEINVENVRQNDCHPEDSHDVDLSKKKKVYQVLNSKNTKKF